jgi:hypothetical protein
MADLCQTAGRSVCSDHSTFVAPLLHAAKRSMGGLVMGVRVDYEEGEL